MADRNLNVKIINRNGKASEWTSSNPTLDPGEIGVETDTHKIKIGDGATVWTALPYVQGEGGGGGTMTKEQILQTLGITDANLQMAMKIAAATQSVNGNEIDFKGQIDAASFNSK